MLSHGEVINKIKTWNYDYVRATETFPERGGIQFFTTEKTCGPYGFTNTNDTITTEGHTLLSIYGRCGLSFDKMIFVFDRCV